MPPLILLAKFISLGIIVTLLAWIAHSITSSNSVTKKASEASCKALKMGSIKSVLHTGCPNNKDLL